MRRNETTVICIGDSITEGIGSSDSATRSYPAVLGQMLGKEYSVINCGRNGATLMDPPWPKEDSFKGLPHYRRALQAAREAEGRRIVCVMLGTNDADVIDYGFEGRGDAYLEAYGAIFLAEMEHIVNDFLAIDPETRFVLCLSPYSYDGEKHRDLGNLPAVWQLQERFAHACQMRGVTCVVNDMRQATAPGAIGGEAGVARLYRDRLHPNDEGHAYFATCFYKAIKRVEER